MNRRTVAKPAGRAGLGAWTAFGVLTVVVATGAGGPLGPDNGLLSWSVAHRPATALTLARWVTDTGTGVVPYLLAALAGLVAGRTPRHRLLAAALCAACLGAGQALRYGVMELAHRARPPRGDWAAHASGWSFPSGHTTTSALAAGLLIVAVSVRAPRGATPLRLAVGCWAVLVGLTRVYLGVHWSTDVVGGWLFATGWLGMCLWAMSRWLPESFIAGTTQPPNGPTEDNKAPQIPDS
ncbi:phosphatase PAP2 family protein [Streptomyces orinoci]|uniref:Phosphatase PAP2 family protein n=1 Tax=Streptomyces orinoci TaxID=67339 RepID=A0ABV3JZW6_STRON|nr:phosphatase PAP2 family protein [Streptomyces orinoci]